MNICHRRKRNRTRKLYKGLAKCTQEHPCAADSLQPQLHPSHSASCDGPGEFHAPQEPLQSQLLSFSPQPESRNRAGESHAPQEPLQSQLPLLPPLFDSSDGAGESGTYWENEDECEEDSDPAFQDSEAREVTDSEEEADGLGFDGTPNPALSRVHVMTLISTQEQRCQWMLASCWSQLMQTDIKSLRVQ